jgi:peptide/nickel transport system ATP-binding protein
VSFTVAKGETLAIVGESGSGKSVTAYAVMGILDPAGHVTGGTAMLGGLDLLSASNAAMSEVRGREIAMIFQNPRAALNPIRSVGRQIADVLIRHGNVPRGEAPERAIDMLRAVGIPDPSRRAKAYPFEMSGGMCQRVMIAIALACDPKLLIADEPTTALDVTVQAQILELMEDLRDRLRMTMILITHDLGVVAEVADRVLFAPDTGYEVEIRGEEYLILKEDEIKTAIFMPPETTRAFFRGRSVARFNDEISSIQWDEIVFKKGMRTHRVTLPEPSLDARLEGLNAVMRDTKSYSGLIEGLSGLE